MPQHGLGVEPNNDRFYNTSMKSKIQTHKYRMHLPFFSNLAHLITVPNPCHIQLDLLVYQGSYQGALQSLKHNPPYQLKRQEFGHLHLRYFPIQSNIAPRKTPNIHTCYISSNVTYILQIYYSSHSPHPGTWTHSCFHPPKTSCAGPVVHPLPQLDEAKVGAAVRRFDKSVAKDLKTATVMKRF